MGVNKKPAVKAKTARKVRINAAEAAYAKSQGISLEELAKSKLPKRGRPVGSKNKPKAGEALAKLGGSQAVDWEKLCKQLQGALAAQIKETDQYKSLFEQFQETSTRVSSLSFWQRITLVFTGKI